ncbi:MAG: cache domain-containing protein [Firmicutes bacterium]|nr:cache domain-containing protein [Bacillota bacterium]
MKRFVPYGILIVCLMVAATGIVLHNTYFSKQNHGESRLHLEEIYTQINQSVSAALAENWTDLKEWDQVIRYMDTDDEKVREGLEEIIGKHRLIEDFYFISENGSYITVDGRKGYLNIGQDLPALMKDKKEVVSDSTLPSGEKIIVFAVPVEKHTYGDFAYSALAMSYKEDYLGELLDVEVFSGKGRCYIAYNDGRILVDSAKGKEPVFSNMLTYLADNAKFRDRTSDDVISDWNKGIAGVTAYEDVSGRDLPEGTDYYFVYLPMEFDNWMFTGFIAESIVHQRMK